MIELSKILLVEDEIALAMPISGWLAEQAHIVDVLHDGLEAMEYLKVHQVDCVILDLMLPGMDGLDVCRQYRASGGNVRILMLTARKTVEDKELGLDAGADDYLEKPFNLKELAARLRALLRRSATMSPGILEAGSIKLDTIRCRVWRAAEEISVSSREFSLLEFLILHPRQYFSADAIIEKLWKDDDQITPEAIRLHIRALRQKVDAPGQNSMIKILHGVGYKLDESCDV